jgi:hypothetical protein
MGALAFCYVSAVALLPATCRLYLPSTPAMSARCQHSGRPQPAVCICRPRLPSVPAVSTADCRRRLRLSAPARLQAALTPQCAAPVDAVAVAGLTTFASLPPCCS